MKTGWMLVAALALGCGGSSAGSGASPAAPLAAQGLVAEGGAPVELVPQLGLPSGLANVQLEMSPDGVLVVARAPDALQIFEVATGKLLRTVRGAGPALVSATWLAGKPPRLIGLGKGALVVLDPATGQPARAIVVPDDLAVAQDARVTASADGRRVATVHRKGAFDATVAVWDVAAGGLVGRFDVEGRAPEIALAGDGASVLVAGKNGVEVWGADGKRLRAFEGAHGDVTRLALSGDGKRLVVVDSSRKLIAWDVATGARVAEMETRYGADALAVSRRGDIALTADLDTIQVWSLDAGKPAGYLAGGHRNVRALAMTPDGALAVAAHREGLELWEVPERRRRARVALAHDPLQALVAHGSSIVVAQSSGLVVWDLERLRVVVDAPQRAFEAGSIALSADGSRLVTSGQAASVFDLPSATLARGLRGPKLGVTAVAVSRDGKLVATGARDEAEPIRLYGPEGQDPIATLGAGGDGKQVDALGLSADATRLVALAGGKLETYDVASRARLRTAPAPGASSLAMSPDGKTVVTDGDEATLWDVESASPLGPLSGARRATAVAFSSDGKRIVVAARDGTAGVWSATSRARETELPAQPVTVVSVGFAARDRLAVLGRADGAVRAVRLEGAAAKSAGSVTLLAHAGQWLVHGDDGLFDASRHGTALAAVVQGERAFDIDQLAVRLNRPDVLLERLGLGAPAALEHYRARHLRRLRKAGLKPEDLSGALAAPESRIERAQREGKSLTLSLDMRAAREALVSYDVWVNGVPVFEKSKAVTGTSARVTERVELGSGANHVEVSCRDRRGTESNRAQVHVDVTEKSAPSVFYVGFGVSRYKDSRLDLGFAHKDAVDLGRAFERLQDRKVKTKVFVDQEVTLDNVRAAKSFLREAGIDDTVVVFVAGHGVHAKDADRTYYYLPHGVDTKRLEATAIPFEAIEDVLYGVRARNKLLLLDTCQSGEFDPAEQERVVASAKSRGIRARAARGLVLDAPSAGAAPKRSSWAVDRDRFIENDVLRRSGAVVFSSSRGHELSYESDEMKNGYFTAGVLRALRSRIADTAKDTPFLLTADELHDFVAKWVADKTEGRQHPTIDRDNPDSAVAFPVVPGPAD